MASDRDRRAVAGDSFAQLTQSGQTLVLHDDANPPTQRLMRRSHPTIIILEGPQIDHRILIDQPELWIGRDTTCDIPLSDGLVSRRHARVVFENHGLDEVEPHCCLIDNQSTNGTTVNGQRITSRRLEDSDRFAIGRTLFGYFLKDTLELDADARLFRRATIDPLTGLKNRRMFDADLPQEYSRSQRYGRPLSIVMLDIDHFKQVNDTYGHPIGDEVLRLLGRIIQTSIREQDAAYRYGGEEIALLLPETDRGGALVMAERLRTTIQFTPLILDQLRIAFTASLGVATFTNTTASAKALLEAADEALYRAKREGRNRVEQA